MVIQHYLGKVMEKLSTRRDLLSSIKIDIDPYTSV